MLPKDPRLILLILMLNYEHLKLTMTETTYEFWGKKLNGDTLLCYNLRRINIYLFVLSLIIKIKAADADCLPLRDTGRACSHGGAVFFDGVWSRVQVARLYNDDDAQNTLFIFVVLSQKILCTI